MLIELYLGIVPEFHIDATDPLQLNSHLQVFRPADAHLIYQSDTSQLAAPIPGSQIALGSSLSSSAYPPGRFPPQGWMMCIDAR